MIKDALDIDLKTDTSFKKKAINSPKSVASLDQLTAEIEKRTRAERILRKNEEQFRSIVENFISGIFVVDRYGKIIYLNGKACEIFGYSREEMIGRDFREYFTEESKQIAADRNTGRLTGENSGQSQEFKIVNKNGEKIYLEASTTMINAETEKQQTIVQVLDITEKKQLTDHLQQVMKIEAISDMAGGIAHQFNNALSGIIGNIDLIEMIFSDNLKLSKYTKKIRECSQRMAQLTSQLLAYARSEEYQPEKLFLQDLIRDTLPLIKHAIDPAIRIETDWSADKVYINGDMAQMQMVLMAVLANASEAIEDNGLIQIILKNETIADSAITGFPDIKPGDYLRLSVKDNGKGMDEDTQKRIFDPFFTTRFLGRGLGMAAVYGIIINHSGGISIDSEPGRGTTVTIYLPVISTSLMEQPGLPAD